MSNLSPQDFKIIKLGGTEFHADADSIALVRIQGEDPTSDDDLVTIIIYLKGVNGYISAEVPIGIARMFIQDWYESKDMKIYYYNDWENSEND